MASLSAKTYLTDDVDALLREFAEEGACICRLLDETPVSCPHVRELAERAHAQGNKLVVDASIVSLEGTAAGCFGADIVVATPAVDAGLHRVSSDTAQAFAAYLSCHPAVFELRYPGLKSDPSFTIATQVLVGGFGPRISWRTGADVPWELIDVRGHTLDKLIRDFEARFCYR